MACWCCCLEVFQEKEDAATAGGSSDIGTSTKTKQITATSLDRNVQQLSPQQQGQILSDIQQHQHRFNLHQQGTNDIQQPQVFNRNQQILAQSGLFGQQLQQQFVNQANRNKNILSPAQAQAQLSTFPSRALTPEPQRNSLVFPSIGTPSGSVIQHHTQTSFTPSFLNPATQSNQLINTRPTADPIELINQQIRQLDPEKDKHRIKELQDKKTIIEKHNQFIEKQYEKALKKAQQEHQAFVNAQKEQRKKLYQNLLKPQSSGNSNKYLQSLPRYIYPEEAPLFDKALKQYYREHPTTTTTTTTTPTPTTATVRKSSIKKGQQKPTFLPTIAPIPVAASSSSSSSSSSSPSLLKIKSLDDLEILRKQYKNQQINKDVLLAQLRAAIRNSQDRQPNNANVSAREFSLANGKKVQLIETADSKFIPQGKEEEITLPNGDKVIAIRADPNLWARSNNPAISGDEITLPNGQRVQVIRTTKTDGKNLANFQDGQEITLPDGQKAEIFKTSSSSARPSYKSQEITLPNGQRVEVIKTSDPELVPGGGVPLEPGSDLEKLVLAKTTAKPPKAILEELTKSVVPAGSDFELLKTDASGGGLEKIGGTPSSLISEQKRVTFVLLEEQSDGSLKVQGVKGSGSKDKPDVDLDSILKKIKAGEIKLPTTTPPPARPKVADGSSTTTTKPKPSSILTPISVTVTPNSFATNENDFSRPTVKPLTTRASEAEQTDGLSLLTTNFGPVLSSTSIRGTTPNSIFGENLKKVSPSSHTAHEQTKATSTVFAEPDSSESPVTEHIVKSNSKSGLEKSMLPELTTVLKENGLYAMARFIKQSGLDTVLNDTGPYTVFAPTDKAFRTLLVQLGGPEKAEEKFKENPRLLSGLLLHHVIPGSFAISSLQDEMTGVSLAGTQLRVNQYNMHDNEWNDVKISTINGARVLEEHHDVPIPQGIAHAVDKVMFPLPVGDLVQTMQADREKRFTSFLRAIFASGLAEMLVGPKTLTLFAPTDKAFAGLSPSDLTRTVSDPVLAKELVLRHLILGALYTNGMRYYQVKDSLQNDAQISISKHLGKIKVNNLQLTTANIPATNGVIHAIDGLL